MNRRLFIVALGRLQPLTSALKMAVSLRSMAIEAVGIDMARSPTSNYFALVLLVSTLQSDM
jgi:hypothetical protein